jgi:glycosyltransferase involved in cell wall biosynthesis
VGFQNQRRLSRYYHAADLLVLPSHSETWGLVVNEALHHGVPVVVSDRVGCAPDLVENGQTGEVFASGSAAALTGSIVAGLRLCDAPGVRDRCRMRVSGYTIDRAAEGMAEAYWSAVRRDRAA